MTPGGAGKRDEGVPRPALHPSLEPKRSHFPTWGKVSRDLFFFFFFPLPPLRSSKPTPIPAAAPPQSPSARPRRRVTTHLQLWGPQRAIQKPQLQARGYRSPIPPCPARGGCRAYLRYREKSKRSRSGGWRRGGQRARSRAARTGVRSVDQAGSPTGFVYARAAGDFIGAAAAAPPRARPAPAFRNPHTAGTHPLPLPPPRRSSRSRQLAGTGRAEAERAGRPPEPPPVAQAFVGARRGGASELWLRFGCAVAFLPRKAKASAGAVGMCPGDESVCSRVSMCCVSLCDPRAPSRSQSFLSPIAPRPDIPGGRLPTSSKSQGLSSPTRFNCLPGGSGSQRLSLHAPVLLHHLSAEILAPTESIAFILFTPSALSPTVLVLSLPWPSALPQEPWLGGSSPPESSAAQTLF